MFSDYFQLAIRNIRHRKRRSWLTIIGTLIGIMAVVSLISIGQGLESSIQSEFERLGGDKVFVSPGNTANSSLTESDLRAIKRSQGVEEVAGRVTGNVRATYRDETTFVSITGVTNSDLSKESLNLDLEEGRFIRSTDTSGIVAGSGAVENLFEDQLILRTKITISEKGYRIIGIGSSASNPSVHSGIIMQMDEAREVLDQPDTYDSIVAQASTGFEPTEAEENIKQNLRQERNVEEGNEDFQTQTADDIISSFQNQLAIVRAVLVGIGAISLLVGGVGIMNTMYTSVTQRTREIGIMKAVGASQRQILLVFLIESGIIGMIGGIIGVTLGLGISVLATDIITQQIGFGINAYISPLLIIGSIIFSFIVGMISGILPAQKASKLRPVEALSYD